MFLDLPLHIRIPVNNNLCPRLSSRLVFRLDCEPSASSQSFWCSETAEAVRAPIESLLTVDLQPLTRPTTAPRTTAPHCLLHFIIQLLFLSSDVQAAGSSSRPVVGKSRTTGSFLPTGVSSTIAKHCGRGHQICVASRLQVTEIGCSASMVTADI